MGDEGYTETLTETGAKARWRAYGYDQTVTSEQGWGLVPSGSLLAVVWQAPGMPKPDLELGAPWYYCHEGEWIKRVWDPTLYLRGLGAVKFGRWASPAQFTCAWQEAVKSIMPAGVDPSSMVRESRDGAHAVFTGRVDSVDRCPAWWLYYDNQKIYSADQHTWAEAPTDGVLAACYRVVVDGVAITVAKRRYTFYHWVGPELANTDDLEALLAHYPQFKKGRVSLEGLQSPLGMVRSLRDALADTLEDLPWPS